MNWEFLANSNTIANLGWTLVHSVWQIAFIAAILFILLRFLRRASANARYSFAVAALAISCVLPIITFVQLSAGNSSAEIFQTKNSASEIYLQTDENLRRRRGGENFSDSTGAETVAANPKIESVFASVESLQNYFDENFSAALPFFVGVWMFGVALFAFRLGGGVWQLRVYKTRQISAPDAVWQKKFASICEKLKITKTVKFLRSDLVETPVVIGWFKPVILIPASVFLQISAKELETVIAHELVHIRRYDALVNFAQSIAEVLFFYHPCVWWMSSVIRREREFATDASVVEIFGAPVRFVYANALANLEEIRLLTNQKLTPLATAAANGGNLMQRIQKILQKNTEIKRASSAWSAGLAFVLISAVLLTVFSFNEAPFVNGQTLRAEKRKMAVGFVSLPPLDRTANAPKDADATMRLLIEKLKSHKVPAIGFLQGGMVADESGKLFPVRANIVRLWRDAGFEIGIGNYKHVWFYDTPYDEYVAGVERNEQITKKILAEKNLPLRYFSYPYLNTGKSAEDRNRFEAWLNARGITPVKYTFDNQEWMYSYAYDLARNDNDVNTMNEVRAAFVDYMSKMLDHYEAYSREMFNRDIAQTMVLTPSRLVTDSADELFGMIEKRGYKFVSMEDALSDDAYKTEENFINTRERIGKSGISWFERWQMSQGKKLRDEPRVDTRIEQIWNERKPKGK